MCTYTYMFRICVHIHIRICIYIHICCAYIYIHIYAYIYICVAHIYIRIYIYIYVPSCWLSKGNQRMSGEKKNSPFTRRTPAAYIIKSVSRKPTRSNTCKQQARLATLVPLILLLLFIRLLLQLSLHTTHLWNNSPDTYSRTYTLPHSCALLCAQERGVARRRNRWDAAIAKTNAALALLLLLLPLALLPAVDPAGVRILMLYSTHTLLGAV